MIQPLTMTHPRRNKVNHQAINAARSVLVTTVLITFTDSHIYLMNYLLQVMKTKFNAGCTTRLDYTVTVLLYDTVHVLPMAK